MFTSSAQHSTHREKVCIISTLVPMASWSLGMWTFSLIQEIMHIRSCIFLRFGGESSKQHNCSVLTATLSRWGWSKLCLPVSIEAGGKEFSGSSMVLLHSLLLIVMQSSLSLLSIVFAHLCCCVQGLVSWQLPPLVYWHSYSVLNWFFKVDFGTCKAVWAFTPQDKTLLGLWQSKQKFSWSHHCRVACEHFPLNADPTGTPVRALILNIVQSCVFLYSEQTNGRHFTSFYRNSLVCLQFPPKQSTSVWC